LKDNSPIAVFVPLGSQPSFKELSPVLVQHGFLPGASFDESIKADSCWIKGNRLVLIGTGQFARWAPWGEVGLANAGTATEQLVGLGIPALSLPGRGPQFTFAFAMRQSRLLGGSVIPCKTQEMMAMKLQFLFADETSRKNVGKIGSRRMGPEGGSSHLAALVLEFL